MGDFNAFGNKMDGSRYNFGHAGQHHASGR
jgi:hypothetical protein